jgi:hypothetical protein
MSIVVNKNPLDSSMATEQLKAVQAENTLMIQEQQDMKTKMVALGMENTWQSTRIAQLEQQLQATEQRLSMSSSSSVTTMSSPRQETKGNFFRKLLNSPSVDGSRQRGSVHGPSKAELVSQGLGVVEGHVLSEPNNLVLPLVEPSLPEAAGTEAPSVATEDENAENAPSPPATLTETEPLSQVTSV